MSFLSSLVSSPSAAQTAAKDLWPTGLLPQAEEEIQSALADGEPELLSRGLCAAKGKVRNALRLQAALPPATSRLRAAQRGFRPKMAPAAEIGTCKFHKQRSARNYRIRKDFPPHYSCKSHKPRYLRNSRSFIKLQESIGQVPRKSHKIRWFFPSLCPTLSPRRNENAEVPSPTTPT